MKGMAHALAAGFFLLSAGCAVGPDYKPAVTVLAPTWQEARQVGIDTQLAELAKWWTEFKMPADSCRTRRQVQMDCASLKRASAKRAYASVSPADLWQTVDVSVRTRRRASGTRGLPSQGPWRRGRRPSVGAGFVQDRFRLGWEIEFSAAPRRRVERGRRMSTHR